jgi:hypothetical protein
MVFGAIPARWFAGLFRDAEQAKHWNVLITSAAIVGYLLAVGDGPPGGCAVDWLFGHACPFCGVTHATVAALHLHLSEAFSIHPAGPAVAALLAGSIVARAAALGGLFQLPMRRWLRMDAALNASVVLICIVNWALMLVD